MLSCEEGGAMGMVDRSEWSMDEHFLTSVSCVVESARPYHDVRDS